MRMMDSSSTTTTTLKLTLQQRIQSVSWEDYVNSMKDITIVVLMVWLLTAILELWCYEYVMKLRKQQPGLYIKAILYNILNPILIGIPLYPIAPLLFCCDNKKNNSNSNDDITFVNQLIQVFWIIITHSIQYYYLHKLFHLNTTIYKNIHSFHHKFNTFVIPSSGNAVTLVEFLIAYLGPVLLSTILYPSSLSLQQQQQQQMHPSSLIISVYILQITHLFVHTPKLELISSKYIPKLFVSTKNHLDHHRLVTKHYASPTINIDTIINYISSSTTANTKKATTTEKEE